MALYKTLAEYIDDRLSALLVAGTGVTLVYDDTANTLTVSTSSSGGDVVGPGSATDNAAARFDTTTGKLLQNSTVVIGDTGNVSGVGTLAAAGKVTVAVADAGTTSVAELLALEHTTSGTAAGGFGAEIVYRLESASGALRDAAHLEAWWVTATDASRKAEWHVNVYDTAARLCLTAAASGTAPQIGFLGAAAAAAQTGDAGTALVTFGLMTGVPTFAYANLTGSPTVLAGDVIILREEQTSGTAGGTFTAGAWRTRTLNTETLDTGNHCTLSSNQFTLAAGTYEIEASAPAFYCDNHQARLYNATGATTLIWGTSERSQVNGVGEAVSRSFIRGVFVVAASQALEIQHQCGTTSTTNGFGFPGGFGTEVYTTVWLRRVG